MAELRIISGKWRSRRITFFDYPGIRPSLNQVRETVFNWLQTILPQARCLDLFAGSGAFGIEALSRGAAYVDFIDYHPRVVSSIQQSLKRLDAQSLSQVQQGLIPQDLQRIKQSYDIIFVDPPYATALLQQTLDYLKRSSLLAPGGVIYIEAAKDDLIDLTGWDIKRHKSTKRLQYGIISRSAEQAS